MNKSQYLKDNKVKEMNMAPEYQKKLEEADRRWRQLHAGFKGLDFTCVRNDFGRQDISERERRSIYSKQLHGLDQRLYFVEFGNIDKI